MVVFVKREYFHVHCGPSFEVKQRWQRQTVTCSVRITTVSTGVAPRTCRAEAHRTLPLGIRKCSISAAEAAMGIPAVPYQAESLAPLGCFDRSHWTFAWAFVTEHLQNALPPRCKPTGSGGASRWPRTPGAREASGCCVCPQRGARCVTPRSALSKQWCLVAVDDSSCEGALQLGAFFKLWKLKLIF